MVPHRLFAAPGELVVGQRQAILCDPAEIGLDGDEVLRGRGHDAGGHDDAILVELVAVEEQAAWCLRGAGPDSRPRGHGDGSGFGWLVGLDQPQCLMAGEDQLHGPHDDALEGIDADGAEPGPGCRMPGDVGELGGVERIPGQGPGQVVETTLDPGLQGSGPGDVLFDHQVGELGGGDVEAVGRRDPTGLDRVAPGAPQGDEAIIALDLGEVEPRHPLDGGQSGVEGQVQGLGQGSDPVLGGGAVEAAHLDVDGVDGPTADRLHELVAGPLQRQPAFDGGPVPCRQLDGVGAPEEVRRVKQVDVECVALDPLATVEEPAQGADRFPHRGAACVLHGCAGTHLVGDGADPTDPGGDVR